MASGSVEESRHLLKQLSHQSSSESCIGEELDLLTNVYFDDLQIAHTERGPSLSLHVTPSTADDKDKQFVYLDLTILLPSKYPQVAPVVSLGQSRGLSDAHLRGISEGLVLKCTELLGCPMVYELVEYARECLTDNNLPCSRCAICQVQFQEGDDFTKTECYHYLHVACLARYIDFFERDRRESEREAAMMDTMLRKKPKQLECPVCRDPIAPGSVCLDSVAGIQAAALPREDEETHFTPSPELKAWQDRMASLLWKQKQKGGVIDPNSEDDVIDETWVSSISRKQGDEIVEDSGSVILAEKPVDNNIESLENEKELMTNGISREIVEGQRTDSDRTESKSVRASEKQGAGERRRREVNKNGHISEKRIDGQRSGGGRNKRTYNKQRCGQREEAIERTREQRGRGNGQQDHSMWREEGENGQRGYWQTSERARRPDSRGQRSNRGRQRGGGRTSKSSADSVKDHSSFQGQKEERPRGEAMQPGAGAGVMLKTRNRDKQDRHEQRHETVNGELQKSTA